MNPMQMLQGMRNPQQFLQQMMGNSSVMKNPMARNAMQMAQKGDSKGIEQMARNYLADDLRGKFLDRVLCAVFDFHKRKFSKIIFRRAHRKKS